MRDHIIEMSARTPMRNDHAKPLPGGDVDHTAPNELPRTELKIAVLVPCFNEEVAISHVVTGFRRVLPKASIFVYDNNSDDRTVDVARAAGAVVRREPLQGKGNVVRRMFSDIDADVYVLVDGDATYDPQSACAMVDRLVTEQLDMVVGSRVSHDPGAAYRRGHQFGNVLLTGVVTSLFGNRFTDILSGYRVFSKRFVKSFPALAKGFETETELTVHALELGMPVAEVETPYASRPEGSTSKLRTYRDGLRILRTIMRLFKNERPFAFFGVAAAALCVSSVSLAWPLFVTYVETGLVPRLPTAILASGMMVLAFLSLSCGLILDTVTQGRREARRLAYLAFAPAPYENEQQ
jgi:hypothetical protein